METFIKCCRQVKRNEKRRKQAQYQTRLTKRLSRLRRLNKLHILLMKKSLNLAKNS
jgi:hypothetical protein